MSIIHTERLLLRPFSVFDCDDLFEFTKDPVVALSAGFIPHKSIEDAIELAQFGSIEENNTWAIVLDSKVIGSVALQKSERYGYDLGFILNPKYWGNGYATESAKAVIDYGFNVLDLKEISCDYYDGNIRSKRVIEKLGFKFLRIELLKDERYINKIVTKYIYRLFKEEAHERV